MSPNKALVSLLANKAQARPSQKLTRMPQLHREMTSAKTGAEPFLTEREGGLIYNLIIKETLKGFASRA
jgi:hypothetical protein